MKIAIITGASSGLGREFAVQIAQKYRSIDEIWLVARRQEQLSDTAAIVEREGRNVYVDTGSEDYRCEFRISEGAKRVRILPMDITEKASQSRLQELLESAQATVRILVNGAGYGMIGEFTELSCAENTGMVDLNCGALTAITYAVLPYMEKNANIINVASAAAFLPQPEFAVYAASKAYVLSFSRALHRELRNRRIAVTAVCPGPVDTGFFQVAETYHKMKTYKKLVMAKPEKVVELALKDAYHRRGMSVYGGCMKLLQLVSKLLPR